MFWRKKKLIVRVKFVGGPLDGLDAMGNESPPSVMFQDAECYGPRWLHGYCVEFRSECCTAWYSGLYQEVVQ